MTYTICMTSYSVFMAWHEAFLNHTIICMISHPLYLWHHIQYIWYHPYHFHDNRTTIPDILPTIFDITATVSLSSHLLYQWHNNKYGNHHTCHTYDIKHILNEKNIDNLWYQFSVFMTSQTLYLTSNPCYLCHDIHCIDDITPTEFMRSHPLYMMTSYPLYTTTYLLEL